MAGGKETPRQKLIGLMYLVLLALLALQVSSAIMEKFKFLDDSLQIANDAAEKNNDKVEQSIEKAVVDGGNKDAYVIDYAKQVRDEAEKIKKHIEALRKELVDATGGMEEGHGGAMWKGAKEETKVEVFMIGAEGSKSGKGYVLQKEINGYIDRLNDIFKKAPKEIQRKFEYLAKDAKEDERIPEHSEQKHKDFPSLNFGQTPMCAAMAVLSTLEADVLKTETEALAALQNLVGAKDIKFDKIFASYSAESAVIASGTKYKANVFIQASSSTLKPKIIAQGKSLEVKDGIGTLEFVATADGGSPTPDGMIKKTWSGTITINHKGKDTTFNIKNAEYYVVKPVIQVQAGALSSLYEGCPNYLSVQVPALGAIYAPVFGAVNATSSKGNNAADKGSIAVVPNDGTAASKSKVKISVTSGGQKIGDVEFGVRKVPMPTIKITINGAPWDGKTPIKPSAANIGIKWIADENFKQAVGENEAKFGNEQWTIMLAKGKRSISQNEGGGGASFTIPDPSRGDRVVLEFKKIKRAGKKSIEMTSNNIYIIPVDNGK